MDHVNLAEESLFNNDDVLYDTPRAANQIAKAQACALLAIADALNRLAAAVEQSG